MITILLIIVVLLQTTLNIMSVRSDEKQKARIKDLEIQYKHIRNRINNPATFDGILEIKNEYI